MQANSKSKARHWTGDMVWQGQEIAGERDWIVNLNKTEVAELTEAIRTIKKSHKPLSELSKSDIKLNQLADRLSAIQSDVIGGRGFVLIKGLPANKWSDSDLVYAYWCIGKWIGDAVSQNASAHLLGHVIDQRLSPNTDTRIYQTNREQPFHSDSCDIVGLLCLRVAKSGGASAVASSAAIHNDLLVTDPAALETLYGEFQCDRYGEIPEGKNPYYPVHIFNKLDGELVCCGMDPDIRSAQRLVEVPPLTSNQLAALDVFQSRASELSLPMQLERGDIQLLNNHTVVHARTAFDDYAEPHRRRYLVRLWLSSARGRKLPDFLKERWGNIKPGTVRGGIRVPGAMPVVQLNADD